MPLYDRTYSQIRNYDNNTIVFYEPVTWGVMSNKDVLGTGFTKAPGNDNSRTALSWHYYCWLLDVFTKPIVNDTYPEFARKFCDEWQLKDYFKTVEEDLNRIGGGASFLTEFGTCVFRDPTSGKINTDECKYVLDASDKHFQSWAYWDSDFYLDNFEVNFDLVNIFSRVYPIVTNGLPVTLFYNSTTKYFEYVYQMNVVSLRQASLTTEIFVPENLYKTGFDVSVSTHLEWVFDEDSSRILVKLNHEIASLFMKNKNFNFKDQSMVVIKSK